ncbi:MAG: hypothetical protein ACK48R_18865, partial [Planctomyces sp.]
MTLLSDGVMGMAGLSGGWPAGRSPGQAGVFRCVAIVGALALLVLLAADAGAAKKKERADAITEAVGILQSART